jgi:4'-phosphopantetheinyl transferase
MTAGFNEQPLVRQIPPDVVDLWFTTLPEGDSSLESILSAGEMRRAHLFRFERDAVRFVARRGILRLILATYIGVSPSQLSFTHNHFGKPALAGLSSNIHFSSSHSGDLAVYAVARERDLGVDLEHLQQGPLEIASIAGSFFPDTQIAELEHTPVDRQEEVFLRFWTQLEAQGKALGTGLGKVNAASSSLNSFQGKSFSFKRRAPIPGYVVAVAVQGQRRCSLRQQDFMFPMHGD